MLINSRRQRGFAGTLSTLALSLTLLVLVSTEPTAEEVSITKAALAIEPGIAADHACTDQEREDSPLSCAARVTPRVEIDSDFSQVTF